MKLIALSKPLYGITAPQKTLLQKIEKGGLKVYHFPTKVIALKLSWVKRLTLDNDSSWKILPKHF